MGPGASDADRGQRQRLAHALAALANPVRLALLRELQQPRTLREIILHTEGGDEAPGRVISRQGVREHLDRLLDVGLASPRETERGDGVRVEYILNHQGLFALAEEFRELARLRPVDEVSTPTVPGAPPPPPPRQGGPFLLLVKGLAEGRRFDLSPPPEGTKQWVVGRRRGVAVSLDFDPFISSENAVVEWREGAHHVQDLDESRNGTLVNFEPLAKGASHRLQTGDVLGVGRSILLYRA